jgi:hypothetical protein
MEAKVFSAVPGLEIRIGNYGSASTDAPVTVPPEVADELEATEPRVRIERSGAAPARAPKKAKVTPAAAAPASNGSPSDGGKE